MEPPLMTTLLVGLLLGMEHALDPDHVVAVSTMISRHRTLGRASLVGLFWGLGHTATLCLVALAVVLFRLRMPDWMAPVAELAVGIVLLALGASVVRGYLREKVHAHTHRHGDEVHMHFHSHAGSEEHDHDHEAPSHRTPLLVGMVHGLAGSAALMLLVLTSTRTPALGLLYILTFGIGSIAGMLGLSALMGLPFRLIGPRHAEVHRKIRLTAAATSAAYGLFLIVSTGVVQGIFLRI
jgi:ABC-type nickel/cobalt efflux system permease component RcnA